MVKVIEKMRQPNISRAQGDIYTTITLEEHIACWKNERNKLPRSHQD